MLAFCSPNDGPFAAAAGDAAAAACDAADGAGDAHLHVHNVSQIYVLKKVECNRRKKYVRRNFCLTVVICR